MRVDGTATAKTPAKCVSTSCDAAMNRSRRRCIPTLNGLAAVQRFLAHLRADFDGSREQTQQDVFAQSYNSASRRGRETRPAPCALKKHETSAFFVAWFGQRL